MNPYASFLADNNPTEVIAATPGKLADILKSLPEDHVNRAPAPGKWSIREILCHLADCEIVFAFRIRQTLAQPHHIIEPFDQDEWARPYSAYTAALALEVFAAVRNWNAVLIKSLAPQAFSRTVTHPERGAMTLQTVVETMGGHDINHLRQIEAIVTRAASA
jgi:uncharacterized damage-inducible protein DinB